MIKINSNNLKHYKDKGWCILKSGFSNVELLNFQKKVYEIEINAKKFNYKPGRVYYDYIYDFNLAAVEAPLNNLVCNKEVFNFFDTLKIGTVIKKITGWENTICPLIRLFCMNNYNYSGHWHQDAIGKNNAVQASIIFNDENGFKILKKENRDIFFNEEKMLKLEKHARKNSLPTLLNEKYYDTLNVKLGDIVLFDPFLLHKGSSNNKRLQFHMMFLNYDKEINFKSFESSNFDFYFNDYYDFSKSEHEIIKSLPYVKRSSIYYKLKNSINYYIPIFNILHYLRQRRAENEFDYEIFSNTAYQKKDI